MNKISREVVMYDKTYLRTNNFCWGEKNNYNKCKQTIISKHNNPTTEPYELDKVYKYSLILALNERVSTAELLRWKSTRMSMSNYSTCTLKTVPITQFRCRQSATWFIWNTSTVCSKTYTQIEMPLVNIENV